MDLWDGCSWEQIKEAPCPLSLWWNVCLRTYTAWEFKRNLYTCKLYSCWCDFSRMVQMTNWIWYWFQWQPSYDRQGHMQARTNYAGCWALVGLPLVLSLPHGHPQTEVKLYTKYKFTVILILMSIWLYLTIQSYIPLLWLPNAVCFAQNTWSCTLTELWLCKVKEWEEEGSENA